MGKKRTFRFIGQMAVVLLGLTLCACATNGALPSEKIRSAESGIDRARQYGAVAHAPLELKLAEDKVKAAKQALEKKEYDKARRLADEALVDAQIAEQKTQSAKSDAAVRELQKTVDTLRREIQQKASDQ